MISIKINQTRKKRNEFSIQQSTKVNCQCDVQRNHGQLSTIQSIENPISIIFPIICCSNPKLSVIFDFFIQLWWNNVYFCICVCVSTVHAKPSKLADTFVSHADKKKYLSAMNKNVPNQRTVFNRTN